MGLLMVITPGQVVKMIFNSLCSLKNRNAAAANGIGRHFACVKFGYFWGASGGIGIRARLKIVFLTD